MGNQEPQGTGSGQTERSIISKKPQHKNARRLQRRGDTAGLRRCEQEETTRSWKGPQLVCCDPGSHRTVAGLSAKLKESTCLQANSGQGEVYLHYILIKDILYII